MVARLDIVNVIRELYLTTPEINNQEKMRQITHTYSVPKTRYVSEGGVTCSPPSKVGGFTN